MACGKSQASPRSQLLRCPPGRVTEKGFYARGVVPRLNRGPSRNSRVG